MARMLLVDRQWFQSPDVSPIIPENLQESLQQERNIFRVQLGITCLS
jgi:hypothetical protein